jgi:hypothetical protein
MPELFKPLFAPTRLTSRMAAYHLAATTDHLLVARDWARSVTLHQTVRHRLLADFATAGGTLNTALTDWWTLDFAGFPCELRKAVKATIPVAERGDWESALATWKQTHSDFTSRLVAIETEINDRVNRLFNLTPADVRLLADHSRHAMIDYPFGEA